MSVHPSGHCIAIDWKLPGGNVVQCQCQLLVTGRTRRKAVDLYWHHDYQVVAEGGRFANPFPY